MLDIAVIGGSISGCITALLLQRAGHQAQIYERSRQHLVGRGGGVATSNTMIKQLQQESLIGPDFPYIPHSHLYFAKRTDEAPELGRCPWAPALDMACVHWSGLFESLRAQVDDSTYQLGKTLVSTQSLKAQLAQPPGQSNTIELCFDDGSKTCADLVVFTDGFRSLGRELMFPEAALDYRGFSVWRGVLEESALPVEYSLTDHPRLSFASMPGSFVTYFMPGLDGSLQEGERIINWAAYLPVDQQALPQYMTDALGQERKGTVPAGYFSLAVETRLKKLMHEQLPATFAEIVDATQHTQFQPISVAEVPAHYRDRMCLVGDAALAIQPLTGSGLFKALQNALGLRAALTGEQNLEQALLAWSTEQTALDKRLLKTGYELEQAFIWQTIDLATASEQDVSRWWKEKIHFPPDYSYLKAEAL